MASSSSSQQPPPQPLGLSHLPCIRALHLNQATTAAVLSVSQAVRADQEASGQHHILAARTLSESKTWSTIVISAESWAKVSALRTQLIRESDSLIPVVTSINPSAIYLYEKAMLVQLHAGVAPLRSFLTMEQDCGLVIPLLSPPSPSPPPSSSSPSASSSSFPTTATTAATAQQQQPDDGQGRSLPVVTAWDETRRGGEDGDGEGTVYYRLQLSGSKAFVVSGTSWLRVEGAEPLVAVVFCLAAGGGEGEG